MIAVCENSGIRKQSNHGIIQQSGTHCLIDDLGFWLFCTSLDFLFPLNESISSTVYEHTFSRAITQSFVVIYGWGQSPASWSVLEAELVDLSSEAFVLEGVREPLAPSSRREASESGVVLVPLNDQLLQVTHAKMPHLCLGSMWLNQAEQFLVAGPLSRW